MPRINKIRTFKFFNDMKKKAEEVVKNPELFKKMLVDAREVLEGKGSGPLKDIADQIKLLLGMLNDYRVGAYRKVPLRTILSIAGAILYLISPIDAIPDFIPVIGMMDDIFVINFVWKQLSKDLLDYKLWRSENAEGRKIITPEGEVREYVTADFKPVDPGSTDYVGSIDDE